MLQKAVHEAKFQHTATRRWLLVLKTGKIPTIMFQHTATRRWLLNLCNLILQCVIVSTHSHPKVAANTRGVSNLSNLVSTHSHPKVAAFCVPARLFHENSFNTQPPEGGCLSLQLVHQVFYQFQHTATRRWLLRIRRISCVPRCFNTQPPEGGCFLCLYLSHTCDKVSTHSHPKVAASQRQSNPKQPRFQHTATRRWLPILNAVRSKCSAIASNLPNI